MQLIPVALRGCKTSEGHALMILGMRCKGQGKGGL